MADPAQIDIPMTSEGVLGLRNAIHVLKEAYKQGTSKQIVQNESALLPLTLEQLKGVKQDLIASKETVNNYYKMTADDKKDITTTDLGSYSEINNVKGNYPVTDAINQEVKKEVNSILGSDGKYSMGSTEHRTSSFKDRGSDPFTNANDKLVDGIKRTNRTYDVEGVISHAFTGAPPKASYTRSYEGKSKGSILNECIPCNLRKFDLDQIQPMTGLLSILEQDLVEKYRRILSQFRDLLTNNEINEDICSLIQFANFQCVPDLFGIISLLQMMVLKLTDVKLINPAGAFMVVLTPFFSPLLNGVNELLDKYVQLILGPVDCVIGSLDSQLAKLDVDRALDSGRRAKLNRVINQRNSLERKKNGLVDRLNYLRETKGDGTFANDASTYRVTDLSTKPSEGSIGDSISKAFGGRVTNEEEILRIEQELEEIQGPMGNGGQMAELNRQVEDLRKGQPTANLINNSRKDLRAFRNTIGKSLEELKIQLVRGKNMINDTATKMRMELTRLILGRAETSEEMLQGAMELQRLARMIGVVQTLIRLADGGKLCENSNDPDVALGNFLTASRAGETDTNAPKYYRGTDELGTPVLLVTTSDAKLKLTDKDNNESVAPVDEGQQQSIAPNIGSIAQKKVSATSTSLGVEVPVSIVKFNLCGDISASTSETVDNIKNWASNLG